VAGVLLFGAAALEAVSAALPWWSTHSSFPMGTSWTDIYPGGSFTMDSPLGRSTASLASAGLGPLGGLYEAVLYLAVILAVFAAIAGLIAVLSGSGRAAGREAGLTVFRLTVLELLIGGATVAMVALAQPPLFSRADPGGICGMFSSASSFCNSFWGQGTAGTTDISWAPGLGWYLPIAAFATLAGALFLWRAARREPWPSPPPPSEPAPAATE
jgi:hypothetical protein